MRGADPLALDDCWLSGAAAHAVADRRFEQGSLYEFLAREGEIRVSGARERVTAAIPDAATRELLAIPRGVAVLVVDRVTYSGEQAFEWRTSIVRGDRFAFVADWSAAPRL